MCGRYLRRSDKQRIAELFRLRSAAIEVFPSDNIAPTTFQPVLRLADESQEPTLVSMRWGLLPSWVTDTKKLGLTTINTRAESILDKPIWRIPFEGRRCLIPANGFYEWQQIDKKTKQPWTFEMHDSAPFAFAGLWERRIAADGLPLESFSIITTEANALTASVHPRMPVILQPTDYERWLTHEKRRPYPVDLLRPYESREMKKFKAVHLESKRKAAPQGSFLFTS